MKGGALCGIASPDLGARRGFSGRDATCVVAAVAAAAATAVVPRPRAHWHECVQLQFQPLSEPVIGAKWNPYSWRPAQWVSCHVSLLSLPLALGRGRSPVHTLDYQREVAIPAAVAARRCD